MNLLVNAIDALEASYASHTQTTDKVLSYRPTIWIVTQSNDSASISQQITIRIRDNGSGISPEYQKKLFDPFFTTKPIGRGTGLGLAISYQVVVDRHGGKLTFSSQPG